MTITIQKTYHLPYNCSSTNLPIFDLEVDKDQGSFYMKSVEKVKYLGVIIDLRLKWAIHIENGLKEFRCFLYKFKRLQEFVPVKYLKILYFAIVESHIR